MKYILQVFTGSWNESRSDSMSIIRRIGEIANRIPVEKVIIGWSTEPSFYKEIGAFLHGSGIRMLLWLPVFSEIDRITDTERTLDIFGNPVSVPLEQDGEGFCFSCPTSSRNIQIIKDIYERYFGACGFDGVFLDRIRTQSFLSGVSGVLSCGCERCRETYLGKGVDLIAVGERYRQRKDAFFSLSSCPANGRFVFQDELAQRFFDAKETVITDAVSSLSGYFKSRGLIVGMDLFAPLVSRFVGQNYSLLSEHADFIKPMLYRRTEAPAGIGYEYALFEMNTPGAQGRMSFTMDRAFLKTQLEAIREMPCERYPGIEINYDENLVRTDADYIRESLAAVHELGFEGVTLCWNIMKAPESHLAAVYAENREMA